MKRFILFCLFSLSILQIKAQCWKEVSEGGDYVAGIKTDGTLWVWGILRDSAGIIINSLVPVQLGTGTNWNTLSAGGSLMVIQTNGTLWGIGENTFGQLGNGNTINSNTLIQIGTATNWLSVRAGMYHAIALRNNGTLWSWGFNLSGQLGDGTQINRSVPAQIGTDTDWQSISANAYDMGAAIKTNGTLWVWGTGNNNHPILGLGMGTFTRILPTAVGTATNWKSISVGMSNVLALKTNGTLWAWGKNQNGQVGNGTTSSVFVPVQIGTSTNWEQVSAGNGHSMALQTSGILWTWGVNLLGQLGNGTNTNSTIPVQVNSATDWGSICAGALASFAIKTDNSLWRWGGNGLGALGNGTTVHSNVPIGNASSPITVNTASVTICAGSSITLSGSGATTYTWTGGIDNGVPFVPASSGIYTVTGTGANPDVCYIATVTIVVTPNTTITAHATATTICAGSIVTLAGSGGGGSYTWSGGVINGASFTPTSTATYSVTNSVGCSNTASITVTVNSPVASVTGFSYLPVCSNDANPSPFLNPGFTVGGNFSGSGLALNAGSGSIDLSNTAPGTYAVTYNVNASNCVLAGTGTATVLINPAPLLSVSSSTTIITGEQTTLTANSSANTYTWFPAVGLTCSDCASPVASPNESTTYCVRTTDGICTNSACVTVIVESLCEGDKGFFLPNAFSPNGDGNNDVFCVQGRNRCVTNFQMIVYDRWGEKVFESSDLSLCWDGTYKGKVLSPDVFVYYIKAQDQNQKELIKKGNVSLIR